MMKLLGYQLKICIILGTRPEIVKFSPIIRECARLSLDYFILHTGQHYTFNMDKVFFDQLKLPQPKYNLGVGSGPHGEQTGKMLSGLERILETEIPDAVLVQGDTNTVLAGAVVAAKLGIKVGHVEAGLRSYDRKMPEEINRVLADHCSNYLFAPTKKSAEILQREGIAKEYIFTVGNTVVDAVQQNLSIANSKNSLLNEFGIEEGRFMLATSHRQENVDEQKRFAGLIKGLQLVQQEFKLPLIYPVHPRARKQMKKFGIDASGLTLIEPLDYLGFLLLESKAGLVLTDSGGVQEEACVLGVPCVTLRDNTERPETVDVGANMLAGTSPQKILDVSRVMFSRQKGWSNPFGDGKTGQKIMRILLSELEILKRPTESPSHQRSD